MNWETKTIDQFWKNWKEDFQGDRMAEEIIRLSKKFMGKKVLDIGAGSGALIKKIPRAIGIDLVKRPGIIKGSINNIPFHQEQFDTVFATEVLEHLSDKDLIKGLQEVHRVLKKDGYFIATTPFDENLEERMVQCPQCGAKFHRMQHLRSFNKEKMIKLLTNHKFKVVKISQEPYDFARKIGRFTLKYKYIRFLRPLLNKVKKGNLLVIARKN